MSACLNALRESATREELLAEIASQQERREFAFKLCQDLVALADAERALLSARCRLSFAAGGLVGSGLAWLVGLSWGLR